MKVRLTKTFNLEMAHALYGYDGPCRNIHGHSYTLHVTVIGKTIADETNPKCGMVMDFSELKQIVQSSIIDRFDHALVLNENSPYKDLARKEEPLGKTLLVRYQPTCENVLLEFARLIQSRLPPAVSLHRVKLRETASSFAEWYADDNN